MGLRIRNQLFFKKLQTKWTYLSTDYLAYFKTQSSSNFEERNFFIYFLINYILTIWYLKLQYCTKFTETWAMSEISTLAILCYRSGTVNSNTVNSKFHLIRSYCEIFFYNFPNISCLKYTVNSNFHLIRSKTLPTNDFELTVPNLYLQRRGMYYIIAELF